MVLNPLGEEHLLLNYPNECVDHEIQGLLRELSDQTKLVNLLQINLISGG